MKTVAEKTEIQWCDSTVNPTMGCDGCEIWSRLRRTCYAGVLHGRFPGSKGFAPTFEDVTNFPGRMAKAARHSDLAGKIRPNKPWLGTMPRVIFVSDMSDALSSSVTFEYLRNEIITNVVEGPGRRHAWMWLTKRPSRMAEFSSWLGEQGIEWPDNLWTGTSVTTQATTGRIKHLASVGDEWTTRFVSVEPQIEPIDLEQWLPNLDLIIQGGESGNDARPFDIGWARSLRDQCQASGTKYFLKQLGSMPMFYGRGMQLRDGHAGDWDEWPDDLRVREMPHSKERLFV